MKIRKIALLVLICMLVASLLAIAVACEPTEPDNGDDSNWDGKIDLMKASDWEGNESETSYVAYNNNGGDLVIEYETSGQYQYIKRTFIDDLDQLAQVKTLVMKASMAAESNEPYITLKLEGDVTKEVTFDLAESVATYEWDLSSVDVSKASRLLLFAEGVSFSATGEIDVKEFYLTTAAINQSNNVEQPGEDVDYSWNEITATSKTVNAGWYDAADGVYSVAKDGTSYKVTATKSKSTHEWSGMVALIKGDALSTMKSFKITLKGTAGESVLVKPFNQNAPIETKVTFTGEEQTVIIDVESYASHEDRDFSEKDLDSLANLNGLSNDNKVAILALAGATSGTQQFTIISAEFSTEAAPAPVITEEVTEITATNRKVTSAWYSNNDGFYNFDKDGDAVKVSYTTGDWQYFYANVKGDAIANMKKLVVELSGEEGTRLLIKPFDAKDAWVTLTGETDTVEIDITDILSGRDFTAAQKIVVFVEPEKAASSVTGELTLSKVEFSTEAVAVDPNAPTVQSVEYGGDLTLNANNYWHDGGDGKWTASASEGIWTATYPAGNNWSQLVTEIKLGDAKMNYVVLEVKGTQGSKAIFNVGVGEAKFEGFEWDNGLMTGEWQKVVVSGSEITGDVTLRIFAGLSEDCAAGEIQIKTVQMYYVSAVAEDGENLDFNVEGALANAVKGSTRNNISFEAGKTTISYDAPSWDSVIMWIDLGEGGFDNLELEFKGIAGHTAILSLNGQEAKWEGNEWDNGFLTGSTQTMSVDVSGLKGIVFIRIFLDMNPNDANANGGSFEITKAEFTRSDD